VLLSVQTFVGPVPQGRTITPVIFETDSLDRSAIVVLSFAIVVFAVFVLPLLSFIAVPLLIWRPTLSINLTGQ
jgi:hypothetical protein